MASQIAPLLPPRYSPIQPNGHGNQGAYLGEISPEMARRLLELTDPLLLGLMSSSMVTDQGESTIADPVILTEWEDALQASIAEKEGIPETTRTALIQARSSQGVFKANVAQFEHECRITHVHNPTHLIASHIKPWRESSDEERLAGGNGLLLTPSIDHLFDRGFISFSDDGDVLVSPVADQDSLPRMGLICESPVFAGRFNVDQRHFLEYHRQEIFLKSAL